MLKRVLIKIRSLIDNIDRRIFHTIKDDSAVPINVSVNKMKMHFSEENGTYKFYGRVDDSHNWCYLLTLPKIGPIELNNTVIDRSYWEGIMFLFDRISYLKHEGFPAHKIVKILVSKFSS